MSARREPPAGAINRTAWTEEMVVRLRMLAATPASHAEIARQLGVTAAAVGAKLDRLRSGADAVPIERAARQRRSVADARAERLAELMAEKLTLAAAARRMKLSFDEAEAMWRRIKTERKPAHEAAR